MSLTLRFYDIAICFGDDERLMAFAIAECTDLDAERVYKDLLRGRFDKYVTILEAFCERMKQHDLCEWCKDTLYKVETSRNPLFVITDFEHFEVE